MDNRFFLYNFPQIYMSKFYLTLLSLVFFILMSTISCNTVKKINANKAENKSIYIDQFRLTYLRQILIKAYNNSSAVQDIIRNDHSGFSEPILSIEDFKLIDSLTNVDNINMVLDSTQGAKRAEGTQGKRPLGYILERVNSKWLDSLAIERYKVASHAFYSNH